MRLFLLFGMSAALAVAQSPEQELHRLFDQEWERTLKASPIFASEVGDRRYNALWPDLSRKGIEAYHQGTRDALERLRRSSRAALPPSAQVHRDVFERMLQEQVEQHELGWWAVPVSMRDGIQNTADLVNTLSFEREADYADWLARLRSFPVYMDQTIALMREGIRLKLVQPKIIMQRVPPQIKRQISSKPEESPFFKPFVGRSEGRQREAIGAIQESVNPALRRFHSFLKDEYIPACYEGVGIWQAPNGAKLYEHFVRSYTTTRLTPDEVHSIGLREVARIRDEMHSTQRKVGFSGTLSEFFTFLRSDPKFFYKTGEELLEAYRATAKRVDPTLVKLFRTLPRMPYGVSPIPAAIAPDTTTAYYMPPAGDGSRAGTFYVNLYLPQSRPKWEMMALSLHEAVPGHHLQIALAQELATMPKFRRYLTSFTAYVEGWGLYAESLGDELGLYDDPYSKFGQLTYEMWRAVRLVVDTGIHHKRWTRKQAIDYFLANAPKTELDVTNEVDRYIGWPGQALGYKIGELKIKELRKQAEKRLGSKFDVREFHGIVLSTGAVPLDVLERTVNEWLERTDGR